MFYTASKFTGIVIIVLVLLGHHSFQVHAMDISNHHHEEVPCVDHDCTHTTSMQICEKIQSDEMRTSSDCIIAPTPESYFIETARETQIISPEASENYRERIPLSHVQLARSHL